MTTDTIIGAMVERIVERHRPLCVLLFGSRARGTAREDSDVDLLVVLDKAPDKHGVAVDIRIALSGMPVAKDIIVTTPEEIRRRGHVYGTVLREALQEGTVMYERE